MHIKQNIPDQNDNVLNILHFLKLEAQQMSSNSKDYLQVTLWL